MIEESKKRIKTLSSHVQCMLNGDLDSEVVIEGDDEIAELSFTIDELRYTLKGMIEEVELSKKEEIDNRKKYLQKSINNILITLKEIANGNVSVKVEPKREDDEVIIRLCIGINKMVDSLKNIINQVKRSALVINTSVNQMVSIAEEQSEGSNEQAASINETSATVKEFAATSKQIEENANNVLEITNRLMNIVSKGLGSVDKSNSGMREINLICKENSTRIVDLEKKSQAINEVADTIGGIANTTNILSINASIEAAKAGEVGRGFAVVASEIRDISHQIIGLTKRVHEIVSQIQSAVNTFVMASESQLQKATKGVELSNLVRAFFIDIKDFTSSKVVEASKQITISAKQQVVASDQIVTAMKEIAVVSNQTSQGSKQVTTAAGNLSKIAQRLEENISIFHVQEDNDKEETGK